MDYYRYELIPQLEDRHEIDAAIAIRDLMDEVDRLRGVDRKSIRDETIGSDLEATKRKGR